MIITVILLVFKNFLLGFHFYIFDKHYHLLDENIQWLFSWLEFVHLFLPFRWKDNFRCSMYSSTRVLGRANVHRHVAFICQDNINNIYWFFQVLLACQLDFTRLILLLTTASLLREGHISSTRVPLKAFTCIWLRFFWVILILMMLGYSETVISLYLSEKKFSLLLDVSLYVCISILLIF